MKGNFPKILLILAILTAGALITGCGDAKKDGGVDTPDDGTTCPAGEDCSTPNPSETTSVEICNNTTDDDTDGQADCADTDCATNSFCKPVEPKAEVCDNTIDDDTDGQTDCADSDCSTFAACQTATCTLPAKVEISFTLGKTTPLTTSVEPVTFTPTVKIDNNPISAGDSRLTYEWKVDSLVLPSTGPSASYAFEDVTSHKLSANVTFTDCGGQTIRPAAPATMDVTVHEPVAVDIIPASRLVGLFGGRARVLTMAATLGRCPANDRNCEMNLGGPADETVVAASNNNAIVVRVNNALGNDQGVYYKKVNLMTKFFDASWMKIRGLPLQCSGAAGTPNSGRMIFSDPSAALTKDGNKGIIALRLRCERAHHLSSTIYLVRLFDNLTQQESLEDTGVSGGKINPVTMADDFGDLAVAWLNMADYENNPTQQRLYIKAYLANGTEQGPFSLLGNITGYYLSGSNCGGTICLAMTQRMFNSSRPANKCDLHLFQYYPMSPDPSGTRQRVDDNYLINNMPCSQIPKIGRIGNGGILLSVQNGASSGGGINYYFSQNTTLASLLIADRIQKERESGYIENAAAFRRPDGVGIYLWVNERDSFKKYLTNEQIGLRLLDTGPSIPFDASLTQPVAHAASDNQKIISVWIERGNIHALLTSFN